MAPVCLTASETFLKTGRSRCVWPAFLGFVPPTTLVPKLPVNIATILVVRGSVDRGSSYRTRWLAARGSCSVINISCQGALGPISECSTYVPCFPVKPWKMTLVSPLIRRFSMVCAYAEVLELYARQATWRSAFERRAVLGRACIAEDDTGTATKGVRRGGTKPTGREEKRESR